MSQPVGTVMALWRYPVKSMAGEPLAAGEVTAAGLRGDRTWALLDPETRLTASAKNPRKWGKLFSCRARLQPGGPPAPVEITLPDGTVVRSDQPDAEGVLSSALGRRVTLTSSVGLASAETADGSKFDLAEGTFFDLSPLHLITTATLKHLASLAPGSVFDIRRFRPNLLITTDTEEVGFVENAWVRRTLMIGDTVRLHVTVPCERCVMPTLEQPNLAADPEVLRTAVRHNNACVGVNAEVLTGGTIRPGDRVVLV